MRRAHKHGLSRATAGLILIVAAILITYFGFTKSIPFRHHFEVKADFRASNTLRVNSLVRIAGVNVGRVTGIEPRRAGRDGSRVTMRIDKVGRPIHTDATVALRPRIFLEGNPFLDIQPGSPTAPILGDGEVIPQGQTRTPVQFDEVLTTLQADTRADLVRLLAELSTGLSGRGGIGYNRAVQYWEPAFRDSAIVNDATLGTAPHDLSRYLRAQGEFFGALDRNPPALKALITDFNVTARAFASEQESLKATLTELPRTLRAARPALASLNSSFPPLRRLVADLRPATRSTGPMIDASLPFIAQVRGLVSPPELQGLSSDLRRLTPDLAQLNNRLPGLYEQVREASSCQNEVILPWSEDRVGDPNFPATGKVYQEGVKNLPGLAAESRSGDANGQWARVVAGNGVFTYGLSVGGQVADDTLENRGIGLTNFPLEGTVPPKSPLPEIRYDKPCENQEQPNLDVEDSPLALQVLDDSQINPFTPPPFPGAPPGPAGQLLSFLVQFCDVVANPMTDPEGFIECPEPGTTSTATTFSARRGGDRLRITPKVFDEIVKGLGLDFELDKQGKKGKNKKQDEEADQDVGEGQGGSGDGADQGEGGSNDDEPKSGDDDEGKDDKP